MTELFTEVIPTDDELNVFPKNLQEIRFRKDGKLLIGLFVDKGHQLGPDQFETVVAFAAVEADAPFVFPVDREVANLAFEHPHPYAPKPGRLILEDILNNRAA